MNANESQQMLRHVAQKLVSSEPELTRLDMAVGDGDHGLGMQRGFSAVAKLLADSTPGEDVGELFTQVGTELMATMGGASGAIFGTLFRSGGKGISGEQTLDTAVLARFLRAGLDGVVKRGGAKPGDKTMVDALTSAVEAAEQQQGDLVRTLPVIAEAASRGAAGTKAMVAAFGRAKSLGERAIGHPDPGAISMALILQGMAEAVEHQESVPS